ncbi:MbnP family protein [Fulvivirgaceae bacterium LMO-SS25]
MKKLLFLLSLVVLSSCGDDKDTKPDRADITLRFEHMVGSEALNFTSQFSTSAGKTFTVEDFRYYISNLSFENSASGTKYDIPNSYHLIRENGTGVFELVLQNVPLDDYDKFNFSWGIDAEKNTSLDQTGDLDPANEMAWNWNTGYKFLLLEGRLTPSNQGLVYHIGSNHNYKNLNFAIPQDTQIDSRTKSTMIFNVDILKAFEGNSIIDIAINNSVMGGEIADNIASNVGQGLFKLHEIK